MDFYLPQSRPETANNPPYSTLPLDMDQSMLSTCSSSSSLDSSFLSSEDFVASSLIMRADSLETLHDAMAKPRETEFMTHESTSARCDDLNFTGAISHMCDVKFLVGQDKVPVYGVKAILSRRNRVFHNLIVSMDTETQKHLPKEPKTLWKFLKFRRNSKVSKSSACEEPICSAGHLTIEVPEFEPNVFKRIILFLQSGTISVDISNVIGVMNAAGKFELEDLRSACYRYAVSFINVQSVLKLYLATLQQTDYIWTKQLNIEILKFIDQYGDLILRVEEFENVPKNVAISLLSRPTVRASEETKWDAASRWSRRNSKGDYFVMRDTMKSFTPNINLLQIPLAKFLDEIAPLCSKLGAVEMDVDTFGRAISSDYTSESTSLSSVCSYSATSIDSGYISCAESIML